MNTKVNAFTKQCNVDVEMKDISVAGRILAHFPEKLTDAQKCSDELKAFNPSVPPLPCSP